MGHPHSSQLYSALVAERAALGGFVDLLAREQGLLVENSTDQLLELAEQKTASAININTLAETRRGLLRKNIPELSVETIHDWLKEHSPEGLVIWQEIRTLAERAQQLNQTSGELIQMKLRHNQQSLAALSSAVNKTSSLYGPDGQPSFAPGSGRSLGSG